MTTRYNNRCCLEFVSTLYGYYVDIWTRIETLKYLRVQYNIYAYDAEMFLCFLVKSAWLSDYEGEEKEGWEEELRRYENSKY